MQAFSKHLALSLGDEFTYSWNSSYGVGGVIISVGEETKAQRDSDLLRQIELDTRQFSCSFQGATTLSHFSH